MDGLTSNIIKDYIKWYQCVVTTSSSSEQK